MKLYAKKFLSIMLLLSVGMSGNVYANTLTNNNTAYKVTKDANANANANGPIDLIIRPSEGVSKDEFEKQIHERYALIPSPRIIVNLYDRQSKSYSDSELVAKLNSDVTYGIFSDLRVNGFSQVIWRGNSPSMCDNIEMKDSFKINGAAVGFSFGSGGSWTVTPGLTSATATWTKDYDDDYSIVHDYSNVDFDGYEVYLKQSTTGYFTFGTKTHEVTAVDSSLL